MALLCGAGATDSMMGGQEALVGMAFGELDLGAKHFWYRSSGMLSSRGKGNRLATDSSMLGISTLNCEYVMVHVENEVRSTGRLYV